MTIAPPPREPLPALIDVEELFADAQFAVPSISPDGTRIAYLAPHLGRRNVWVRGIDEDHYDAVPVTHDARLGITTYHWTDDPRWPLWGRLSLAPPSRPPVRDGVESESRHRLLVLRWWRRT